MPQAWERCLPGGCHGALGWEPGVSVEAGPHQRDTLGLSVCPLESSVGTVVLSVAAELDCLSLKAEATVGRT